MPAYKTVMFFQFKKWGWTETYYWSSDLLGLGRFLVDVRDLSNARRLMLGAGVNLQAVRWTDVTPTIGPPFPPTSWAGATPGLIGFTEDGGGSLADPVLPTLDPWTGALVDVFDATNNYRRSLILRGCPDAWIPDQSDYPGRRPMSDEATDAIYNFMKRLGASQVVGTDRPVTPTGYWCLRARAGKNDPNRAYPITALSVVSPEDLRYTVTCSKTVAANPGDTVHLHNVKGCVLRGLNGDVKVMVVTPSSPDDGTVTYTLQKQQCCTGDFEYDGTATIYRVMYNYVPILTGTVGGWVKRNTGRRFFGTRGRSSKRTCR